MFPVHEYLVRERERDLLREAQEARLAARVVAVRRARRRANRAAVRFERAVAQLNSLL